MIRPGRGQCVEVIGTGQYRIETSGKDASGSYVTIERHGDCAELWLTREETLDVISKLQKSIGIDVPNDQSWENDLATL